MTPPSHQRCDLVHCPYCGEPDYIFDFYDVISQKFGYDEGKPDLRIVRKMQCSNCERCYDVIEEYTLTGDRVPVCKEDEE